MSHHSWADEGVVNESQGQAKKDTPSAITSNTENLAPSRSASESLQVSSNARSGPLSPPRAHAPAVTQEVLGPGQSGIGLACPSSRLNLAEEAQDPSNILIDQPLLFETHARAVIPQSPAPPRSGTGEAPLSPARSLAQRPQAHCSNSGSPTASQSHQAASEAPCTSLPTLSRSSQAQGCNGSVTGGASSSNAATPDNRPFWTPTQDRLLLAAVTRWGLAFEKIQEELNSPNGSSPRSIKSIRVRWRTLRRHADMTSELEAAFDAVLEFRLQRLKRAEGWTRVEKDVLRRRVEVGMRLADILRDYKALCPDSGKSEEEVRSQIRKLRGEDEEWLGDWGREKRRKDGDVEMDGRHSSQRACKVSASSSHSVSRLHHLTRVSTPQQAPAVGLSDPYAKHTSPRSTSGKATPNTNNNNPRVWSQHDSDLLVALVPRCFSDGIQWYRLVERFNRRSEQERSVSGLQARWYAMGFNKETAQMLAADARAGGGGGEGSESGSEGEQEPRGGAVEPQGREEDRLDEDEDSDQAFETESLMAYDEDELVEPERSSPLSVLPTLPKDTQQPVAPTPAPFKPYLAVGIAYEPNGVRITRVVPSLEVLVHSPTCVRLLRPGDSSTSSTSSSAMTLFGDGPPAFHLRVEHGAVVTSLRVPQGTRMKREEMSRAGGDGGGGAEVRWKVIGPCGYGIALVCSS